MNLARLTFSTTLALPALLLAFSCSGHKKKADELPSGTGGRDSNEIPGPVSTLPTPPGPDLERPSGAPGGLKVLDWAGFDAAVSYSFDDANQTQLDHYDALQALGVPFTFYLQTGKSEAFNPTWAQALNDGHELGNHTKSHERDGSGIAADTDAATLFIEENFAVTPLTMAAPFGSTSYIDVAKPRFLINRGVNAGTISPNSNTNRFNLPCYTPATGESAESLSAPVDAALSTGTWQIYLLHGFSGGNDGAYQPVEIGAFESSVQSARSHDALWMDTVLEVGAYWIAQKIIEDSEAEVSGDTSSWTWSLPAHFPPGRSVRVTVTGGTLSQEGQALRWDSRGYYEVSLDAGSLMLTP